LLSRGVRQAQVQIRWLAGKQVLRVLRAVLVWGVGWARGGRWGSAG